MEAKVTKKTVGVVETGLKSIKAVLKALENGIYSESNNEGLDKETVRGYGYILEDTKKKLDVLAGKHKSAITAKLS